METIELVQQLREYIDRVRVGEELSGIELSELLQAIIKYEITEGGPYGILLFGKREADLGLNLLIHEFLSLYDVLLPNVVAYLNRTITAGAIESSLFSIAELHELLHVFNDAATGFVETSERFDTSDAEKFSEQEKILATIRECITANLSGYPEYVQTMAKKAIEQTIQKNSDMQMSRICYFLKKSLGEKGKVFSTEYISKLGAANVYFWTSFIIYDDFCDLDEKADPALLPIANMLARNFIEYFRQLPTPCTPFHTEVQEIMDHVDVANAWETQFCRMELYEGILTMPRKIPEYDSYQMKYYPASAHILGPLLMLRQLGFEKYSQYYEALESYFQNYLICMQINDDLHDWKEDLARGHISTVVAKLLSEWSGKYPERTHINLKTDLDELEQLFWERVLIDMCREVLLYAAKSRAALQQCDLISDPTYLEQCIIRNERVAHAALAYYSWSEDFLDAMESIN